MLLSLIKGEMEFMAEIVKSLWKEDDGKLTKHEILKIKERIMEEYSTYKIDKDKPKNNKMYLFLLLTEDFTNIQYLQKFEINYLQSKSKDIRESIRMVDLGLKVKSIERQNNVSLKFLKLVYETVLDKLDSYDFSLNKGKIDVGSRFVETSQLYDEYTFNKIQIIGSLRDGVRVDEVLDDIGSLYNTREWMRFTEHLTNDGFDMVGNSLIDELLLAVLDNLTEREIIVDLGLTRSVQKELNYLTESRGFHLDVESVIGKHKIDMNQPMKTEDISNYDKMYEEGTLLSHMENSEGYELLKTINYVIVELGTITELYNKKENK